MKLSHFFILALFGAFFTVVSCNSKKEEPVTTDSTTVTPTDGTVGLSTEPGAELSAAGGANGEFHFKCPKNCVGGGASAKGNCPICGTELVHNQAFHAQAGAPGESPATPIQIDPTNATAPGTTPPATMPVEPPQNARGDWHYVCSKNCGGGGGAAGNCPKCGAALAHSTTYHQK